MLKPRSFLFHYTVDRYLGLLLLQFIVFSVALFTVIWLCPETLFKLIQYVFSDKLTLNQAGLMLLYHIPPILQQSIPVAVLIGSLFLFRKMSLNLELVAMLSSGLSPRRLMTPVVLVGLLFTAIHFMVQEWIVPVTSHRLEALYHQYQLKPKKDDNFVYVEKNRHGQLDKFILIGQTKQEPLTDFIILYYTVQPQGGVQIARILRASQGYWNSKERAWQLFHGIDYGLDEEGVYRENRHFEEQWVSTSKYPAQLLRYSRMNPINMNFQSLKEYIRLLAEGGQLQDVRFCEVRFYQKFFFPLASLLFAVIGALVGVEKVRTSGTMSPIYGAIILFFYSILIPFATNLGSLGFLPGWLSACVPIGMTALVATCILKVRAVEN